ncbi:hypothetical protein UMM65_16570 [Aureibaculum sp. 2210JD6-5]|uniref:DUF7793 family protein n=1 Tax=Aureibaculum sp. 2210JD6-5 TaxID=3103957 RepID=UPI002AAEA6DA|nr:hypothetical protein [Aureibaculum sp. 2210JD6-5]MDY7396862.1 hypothetical protein [Aureibaculum sp. 2210JD6-5]
MNDVYDAPHAKFWIQNEILHCTYKHIELLDLATAQSIVRDRLHFQQEISYPIFCDIRGMMSSEKSARDYLAKNGSILAKAVAIYDDRYIAEVMSQFYLNKNRPLVPSKLFRNYQEAIEFLNQFL